MNLHHAIMRSFVDRGYPPTVRELSDQLGADATPGLATLAEDHGVVLHPGSGEIWLAHPFSASPTAVWVERAAGDRGWWAPCLWCAMGIVSIAAPDASIRTRYGGESAEAIVTVDGSGRVSPAKTCVHFPIPLRDAWSNVVHWCASVLPFRDPRDVLSWCARHHVPHGEILPIDRVLGLARAWYGGYLDPSWRKWTLDEARAIFTSVGLEGLHWQLPSGGDRF